MFETSGREVSSSRVRQINTPRFILVKEREDKAPLLLEYEGIKYKISSIEDYWLVKDRWWTDNPIYRSYYRVTTVDQDIFVIYKDLVTNIWYKINWY